MVRPKPPCGTRDAESQSGAEGHLLLRGDKIDCWRARVIRKRSRFVRLGATGKGSLHDGTSPVAYSTWHIRSKMMRKSLVPMALVDLCWLLGTSVRNIQAFLRTDVPRSQHRVGPTIAGGFASNILKDGEPAQRRRRQVTESMVHCELVRDSLCIVRYL